MSYPVTKGDPKSSLMLLGATSAALAVGSYLFYSVLSKRNVVKKPSQSQKKRSHSTPAGSKKSSADAVQKYIHPILEIASKLSISILPKETLLEAANRAISLFEGGQTLEALRLADLIIQSDSSVLQALVLRAKIYQSLFFPSSTVEKECRTTLALISKKISSKEEDVNLPELLFLKAEVNRVLGDSDPTRYDQAIKDLQVILDKFPKNIRARCSLAECLRQKEDYEQALNEINQALADDSSYLRSKYFRARILFFMDRQEESLRDLNEVLAQSPRDTASLTLRGFVKKNSGNDSAESLKSAIEDFDLALSINPAAINALMLRSLCHTKVGNHKAALDDTSRIIELQPQNAAGYLQRAELLLEQGKVEEGLADASRANEIEPDNVQAYLLRASAYQGLGKPDMAILDLTTLLEKNPQHVGPRFMRAQLYRDQDKYKPAVIDLTLLLQNPKLPKHILPSALMLRAQCALALPDLEMCLTDALTLHRLDPRNNQAILLIGTVFTQLMDFEQGISWFKKGLENDPENKTFPRLIQTLEDALTQIRSQGGPTISEIIDQEDTTETQEDTQEAPVAAETTTESVEVQAEVSQESEL